MKIRSKYGYIIYKISDDKKYIEIECKGEKGASFEEFTSKLPDGDCRYGVLDVEINTKSGATTNKLIFVAWSDDNASVKPKMLYASSKDALKKALTGARHAPPGPPPPSHVADLHPPPSVSRHQRGVPGDRPRRPRPRGDQEEGRLRLSGSILKIRCL